MSPRANLIVVDACRLNPHFVGGASGEDVEHQHALHADAAEHGTGRSRDAQARFVNHATELDQLRDDAIDGIHGNGKPDPRVGSGRAVDGRVDSDQSTGAVEQRAARVARVNRRVRLNHALDLATVASANFALEPTDDTGRQRLVETERIPDRIDILADDQIYSRCRRATR